MSNKPKNTLLSPTEEKEKIKLQKLNQLLIDFKDKKEIVIKEAILLGEKRVSYFKGIDLIKGITNNFDWIRKSLKEITNVDIGVEPNQHSFQNIFDILFQYKLLLKLYRGADDMAKYPKRLFPPSKGDDITSFEEMKYYWINTHSEVSKKSLVYLLISIVSVLLICMFPIWPLKVKIAVWWIIFITLIILLILTVLSLVVVIGGIIFGYDIFILPNLLETKDSWKDRLLNPLIAYFPREDSCGIIFLRINMGLAILFTCIIAYFNPNFFITSFELMKGWFTTFFNYIQTKIISQHNHSSNSISMIDRQNKIINDIE